MIKIHDHFPLAFHDSKGPYKDLLSPNDFSFITKIQYADSSDIDYLISQLSQTQETIARLKPFERSSILKKVSSLILERSEKLSSLISLEGGKPLKDAKVEVERAASTLNICAEESLRIHGEVIPMEQTKAGLNHLSFSLREPIGPVLALSAFNHPLNLIAHQVGCAIASGCCVVLKPAPATPLCAYDLQSMFIEAGLPLGGVTVVNAEIPEIEKLASSPAFKFVSFIGSAKVGWNLRRIIAPGTRIALEHGGVAPSIVREDAKLQEAIPLLVKSSFYHGGQVCISTQRIFIHSKIFSTFVEKFKFEASKLSIADARKSDTDVGPLIRPSEVQRLKAWIEEAITCGAKLELGNQVSGNQKQYLSPTILSHVPRKCLLMNEEAFGPVVCLNSYEDESELIEYLKESPYIFESSLFTENLTSAINIAKSMPAMTVVINNHNAFRVDWMPFGGHQLSGLGMGGVKYSIEEMTRLKQVIIKY